MSGNGGKRNVVSEGVNKAGNEYKAYDDGAYRYKNYGNLN